MSLMISSINELLEVVERGKIQDLEKSSRWFPTCNSTNLSDQLGFDNWSYPKAFMSLVRMKEYIHVVIDDGKVLLVISYIFYIS